MPSSVSGAAAVQSSIRQNEMQQATTVDEVQGVRSVAGKTFTLTEYVVDDQGQQFDLWVDNAYDESMALETILFGSDEYFELAQQPNVQEWLALSSELILVLELDRAIRITGIEESED